MEMMPSSPKRGSRVSVEVQQGSCYLGPAASVTDILWEQFEYLVAHNGKTCRPGCPECGRLEQLKLCLLQPFS